MSFKGRNAKNSEKFLALKNLTLNGVNAKYNHLIRYDTIIFDSEPIIIL